MSQLKTATRKSLPSANRIYELIMEAILEHRLPPGTQLVEERLARTFGVSRTKVRQAIGRLAHDNIVTLIPRRGAFVSSPTLEEAREVFDARRLIEPELIRRVALNALPQQITRLRTHVTRESKARADRDKLGLITLSGEFHQLIADMAGNEFLARTMRELESLTSLIITLYDGPTTPACPYDEHSDLVDAIEAHDAKTATRKMRDHLDHVEQALDISLAAGIEPVLEEVFARSTV